jgi:hypothetical protein
VAPLGFGHTPYFGDYRSRAAVAHDAEELLVPAPSQRHTIGLDTWTRFAVNKAEKDEACEVDFRLAGQWSIPA